MRSDQLRTALPLLVLTAIAAGCAEADPLRLTRNGAGSAPSLSQGAPSSATTNLTFPETFTLSAGTCGLTTDVHGTGTSHLVIHVTELPDGQTSVVIGNQVYGTAVGDDGSRYVFSYENTARFSGTDATLTLPFLVEIVDNFRLLGQGRAPDIAVQQRGTVQVDASGTPTLLKYVVRGDPTCDPI